MKNFITLLNAGNTVYFQNITISSVSLYSGYSSISLSFQFTDILRIVLFYILFLQQENQRIYTKKYRRILSLDYDFSFSFLPLTESEKIKYMSRNKVTSAFIITRNHPATCIFRGFMFVLCSLERSANRIIV